MPNPNEHAILNQATPVVGEQHGEITVNKLAKTPAEAKDKPKAPKTRYTRLNGIFGSGTHGGMLQPLSCLEYLAGAKLGKAHIKCAVKMEPITHITFDKLKLTFYVCYCPNSRVWTNADKFLANKVSVWESPISSVPVLTSTQLMGRYFINYSGTPAGSLMPQTDLHRSAIWRESIVGNYTPYRNIDVNGNYINIDYNLNVLPFRGYVAIWNDVFRPKDQGAPMLEFKDDTVNTNEMQFWLALGFRPGQSFSIIEELQNGVLGRMPAGEVYENMFRSSPIQEGHNVDLSGDMLYHVQTQQLMAELRSRAENFDLTDEQIIAKIRGARIADENMPQILGQSTVDIHLDFQPQVVESDLHLGADGAYSYTFVDESFDLTFVDGSNSAPREGYIHFMYAVTTPNGAVYQESFPIEFLKTEVNDFHRPDLAVIKEQPMTMLEVFGSDFPYNNIVGWRRKHAEYFKLSNFIRGDFPVLYTTPSWEDTARTDLAGYETLDLSGTTKIKLPTKKAWNFLGTIAMANANNLTLYNKFDFTDVYLRRMLIVDGSEFGTIVFNRLSPQTFMLYGTYGIDISQPIDDRIKRHFIGWGEE